MITFGITGGIASGKSTVTKTFRAANIPIVDADIIAREVVAPGTSGNQAIADEFGNQYILSDGMIDRVNMAKLVFSDKEALERINKIMLPLISAESDVQIKKLHQEGHVLVGYDAALICEMGNSEKFRPLIVVYCPRDMQVARLIARNNLTREEAMLRIEAQMPVEKKLALADYSIDTSDTIEYSIQQTKRIIQILTESYLANA